MLVVSKQTTNRLLSQKWDEITTREQAYFFNDRAYFENKKLLFVQARELHDLEQAIHANLKAATNDQRRAQLYNDLQATNLKKQKIWQQIDNFEQTQQPVADIKTLMQRRQNLRTYISRTQKTADNTTDPIKRDKLLQDIEKYKTEIEHINTQIS